MVIVRAPGDWYKRDRRFLPPLSQFYDLLEHSLRRCDFYKASVAPRDDENDVTRRSAQSAL